MSRRITADLLAGAGGKPVECCICSGQLLPALSAVKFGGGVPEGIIFAGHSECAGRFFLCTPSQSYVSVGGGDFVPLSPIAGNSPFMFEDVEDGTPRAVIVNGSGAVAHSGEWFKGVERFSGLACGVMHCGRLFGSDGGYVLYWSGEGGVSDGEQKLNGAGSLTLDPERGPVLDISEFGEKLVLIRKYGLTVLKMFGSPENFSVEITGTDTDLIYKGTARAVGGRLIFYTASGLHSFDGSVISKIIHRYGGDIANPRCSAVFAGKYYLSCESKTLNGRAVLCYNPADGESYLIDAAADGICTADCVYVYGENGAFRLLQGEEFTFTACTDFGTDRRKTVLEIFVGGTADIEVSNGKTSRKFPGAKGTVRPRLRGESFTVKVTASEPLYSVTATAEACDAF